MRSEKLPGAAVWPPVLACGAWLKNTACLLQGDQVLWSPLHGDLGDPQSCLELEASLDALLACAEVTPQAIAHDLHPDFYSSQLAVTLAEKLKVPAVAVQHHHAHIAALMAEHGLDGPVLGLALDGVGLGSDGAAWGGELLWVASDAWRRLGHLLPLPLTGGDVAAREPWRLAAAALHLLGRDAEILTRLGPLVGEQSAQTVAHMLARRAAVPDAGSTPLPGFSASVSVNNSRPKPPLPWSVWPLNTWRSMPSQPSTACGISAPTVCSICNGC